jgi:hypothetical protein
MRYNEFEVSARMPLPSDEMFEVAADPQRLCRWMPSELAPREHRPGWTSAAEPRSAGPTSHSGMRRSRDQRRLEWSTVTDGCHTSVQIRPAGRDSDVTIHLSVPDRQDGQPLMEHQLRQALRRLEAEANETARAEDPL